MTGSSRLGERIRALRLARGYTLQQVAERSGCSRSFLSMLERGQTDVSARLLQRIAQTFDLTASDLLPDSQRADFLKIVRAGEAPRTASLQPGVSAELLSTDLLQRIQPVLLTLAPGGRHTNETGHAGEEFLYVLEGEVELSVHDAPPKLLRAGDSAYYPSALPHRLINGGEVLARVLTISTPPRLV
ncbi:transcriptional regulator with XRE-family HTH domain [Deinobacterium chartae]|uniref:Transcriptional regulator with XRE-family HTH domain n=1 Tax=Deinobacterium chartae TaxID=521158 RepID=A0A841HZB2_9DEIO|nr:transcriptional regulator with XRE-family HTH domain [Deinobacterium chartae]